MSEGEPTTRELAEAVRDLNQTVDSLRDDVRRSGPTLPPPQTPTEVDYAWLSVLEAPERRRPTVPRMLLEMLFLAACATAAAIADLDAVAIAGVMIGAWVLVALIEWAASRADRRREELLLAGPPTRVAVEAPPPAADPAWYSPPVEQTMLDVSDLDATAIGVLPPRGDDLDATAIGGALPATADDLDHTIEQPGGASLAAPPRRTADD